MTPILQSKVWRICKHTSPLIFQGVRMDLLIRSETNSSSTVSVRSSIYDHIEENGRRYHKYKDGSEYSPLFQDNGNN